jgi:hypothetical protein
VTERPASLPSRPHLVQFHNDASVLGQSVAEFIAAGFLMKEPAVIIATPELRRLIRKRLRGMEIDLDGAEREGRSAFFDGRELLDRFMVGAVPHPERFRQVVEEALARVEIPEGHGLRAFANMVDLLVRTGNPEGALLLERMWNEVCAAHPVSLICAYSAGNLYRVRNLAVYERICAQHDGVAHFERRSSRWPSMGRRAQA